MELGKSCDDTELDARIASLKANQCCTLVYTVSISSSSPPPPPPTCTHMNSLARFPLQPYCSETYHISLFPHKLYGPLQVTCRLDHIARRLTLP